MRGEAGCPDMLTPTNRFPRIRRDLKVTTHPSGVGIVESETSNLRFNVWYLRFQNPTHGIRSLWPEA